MRINLELADMVLYRISKEYIYIYIYIYILTEGL